MRSQLDRPSAWLAWLWTLLVGAGIGVTAANIVGAKHSAVVYVIVVLLFVVVLVVRGVERRRPRR